MQVHGFQSVQIADHHPGGNAQASAQGNPDMGVVATDARTRFEGIERVRAGIAHAIPVRDMGADPFHDGAHLAAAGIGRIHDGLRPFEGAVARAITARQQVVQRVIRQQSGRHRRHPRRDGDVALGLDLELGPDPRAPAPHDEALAQVAEQVDELGRPDVGVERIGFADQPLRFATARPQHGHHRAVFAGFDRQFAAG